MRLENINPKTSNLLSSVLHHLSTNLPTLLLPHPLRLTIYTSRNPTSNVCNIPVVIFRIFKNANSQADGNVSSPVFRLLPTTSPHSLESKFISMDLNPPKVDTEPSQTEPTSPQFNPYMGNNEIMEWRKKTEDFNSELTDTNKAIGELFLAIVAGNDVLIRQILMHGVGFALRLPAPAAESPQHSEPRARRVIQQAPGLCGPKIVELVLAQSTRLAIHEMSVGEDGEFERTKEWTTILHWAVGRSYQYILKVAMEKMHADIDQKDYRGRTALHIAILTNNFGAVKTLKTYGAGMDAKDRYGRTPLQVAILTMASMPRQVQEEKFDPPLIIWFLLEGKKDTNFKDQDGTPLLHLAVRYKHVMLVTDLVYSDGESNLQIDINARDEYGRTALHEAARTGNKKIAKILLNYGADVMIKDNLGMTAERSIASWCGKEENTKLKKLLATGEEN